MLAESVLANRGFPSRARVTTGTCANRQPREIDRIASSVPIEPVRSNSPAASYKLMRYPFIPQSGSRTPQTHRAVQAKMDSDTRCTRSRIPSTRSHPASSSCTKRAICDGVCWPSASIVTTYEQRRPHARRKPEFKAQSYPLFASCRTTSAPASAASRPVPSEEPSSTTTTRPNGNTLRTTSAIVADSFSAGMTTATRCRSI